MRTWGLVGAAALVAACFGSSTNGGAGESTGGAGCDLGEQRPCVCPGGADGFEVCEDAGWSECQCANTSISATDQMGCSSDQECSDATFCNGEEVCVATVCEPGVAPDVDDMIACTIDVCNENADAVNHTPDDTACDDNLSCNGVETCDAVMGCMPGQPRGGADEDGDGFTVDDGDCDDCDPGVNPGAVELDSSDVDEDCDGETSDLPGPCDDALMLDDVDPFNAAAAIDLCELSTDDVAWGILDARYVRVGGILHAPGLEVGLHADFGPNVTTRFGGRMLVLSSGRARIAFDPDACPDSNCTENGSGASPPGFPETAPGCAAATGLNDDIALEVTVRVPTNANGFSFDANMYSFEWPESVCTEYNDQFAVLVNPAPPGADNGNVAFDPGGNKLAIGTAEFPNCDPSGVADYASACVSGCPPAPSPYCDGGPDELIGTLFDTLDSGGATGWLRTSVPVTPGSDILIRFAIWDTTDENFDSTVLIDNFTWLTNAPATVETVVAP